MHVKQPLRAGPFVQVVDVLGNHQQLSRPFSVKPRQRPMSIIGLDSSELGPASIVESMDQSRITAKRFGGANILDTMTLPKTVGASESREAALGGDTGPGQNDNPPNFLASHDFSLPRSTTNLG